MKLNYISLLKDESLRADVSDLLKYYINGEMKDSIRDIGKLEFKINGLNHDAYCEYLMDKYNLNQREIFEIVDYFKSGTGK